MKTRHFVYDGRALFLTPPLTPDTTSVSQIRSPIRSPPPPPPPPRANGTVQIDSCHFLPPDGAAFGLSASALQNIREQMAKSLERMKELEDEVKVIPVLQVQLSVLKEEKRKMLLELRGPQHKINNLNNNINIQDGDKKKILRIDENDLKVQKHCCNVENKEPMKSLTTRSKKDASVGSTINTRDVGVSPVRNRVRTVSTMTIKSPERTPERIPERTPDPEKPCPLIDNTSVNTDLLMHQIYTGDDVQRRINEALRSYETKLCDDSARSKSSVGVQVTIKDETPEPSVRVDGFTQTDSLEKRLVHVSVMAKPRTVEVSVNAVPRTRDYGVSDCTVDSVDCEKCRVKRRSIGVSTGVSGSGQEVEESLSLSLSSLGVPRSKSFVLPESPVKPTTRSFGCGTTDRYTPMLSRATNTDAPTPVLRKDVGVVTLKKKLVDAGVEVDLVPKSIESVHTCDKCSAVIKGVAADVLSRSRETVVPEQSRIPRFTGSSGMSSSHSSPSPSMTCSLTLPSSGSTQTTQTTQAGQRKFMRQDTYTKIPASASSKSSPDRGSASQRKSSSSPTKASVASTTERPEWSDSEESVQEVSEAEMPETNQLFKPIQSEKRVKSEPSKEMRAALKVLHDSLEKHERLQHGAVPTHLRSAYNVVQQEWFKVSSTKNANPFEVEDYLDHFEARSPKLLEYIVNITDNSGNTAMHYAVSHGNFDVVSVLLDSKVCHVDLCNAAGYTSVMLVSLAEIRSEAHKHVVKRLLKLADVNSRGKQHGQTALMLAVSHGRLDTVRLLLEAGGDINIQDEDGSTALMCAAEHGHLEIVKLLLSQPDCDVTIVDYDGSTALTIAMEADHRDIGVLLYAQQHFSRGSSPYASLKSRRSKSVTPTLRSSATPPPTRRTPTTPTSPLPSHKLKFNQSL